MSPYSSRVIRSFVRRLTRIHIGVFISSLHLFVSLLGAGIITAFSLYFIYQSGVQSNLREFEDLAFITKNALEEPVRAYFEGYSPPGHVEAVLNRYLASRPEIHYTILSPNGDALIPDSDFCTLAGVSLDSPEVITALKNTIGHSFRSCPKGERMLYVASIIDRGSDLLGILILAVPFNEVMAPTFHTMRWMVVIALLIVALTVAEGWLGSIFITRPLGRLSQTAKKLSQGDLTARAEIEGPLEVADLANTLNDMSARLQISLESLRTFAANASHELRTPLTSIKLQVEALREGACEDPEVAHRFLDHLDHEIDRLTLTFNDMLDLSQIEGSEPDFQPVDMVELVKEVEAFWETRARESGTDLFLDIGRNMPELIGNAFQLRRLFDNLLDNAIKNTPPGGRIKIILRHGLADSVFPKGTIRIEVNDTGKGIAQEHLLHIFDRFFRIDPHLRGSDGGSGLGLAIARTIVTAHGGTIGVKSQLGTGTTFWIELPVK